MKIFNLLEVQYNQFTQKVKDYLSKTLTDFNGKYGSSTIFGQLINVLSNTVQNIMLYIEDALTEQNKYTAQRKKSIYGLAALSGYNPSLGKAAGAQIKLSFSINNNSGLNVILNNKKTITCTQNGLQYNIILPQEAIVLSSDKDTSDRYLYAVEGRFENQSFIATGGKFYTYNFKFLGNLDADYITVKVNNEKWEYVPSIYDMDADGKQFSYKTSINSGIDLIFGNDVYGRSLKANDVVEIEYLIHDGEAGNIDTNQNVYFVFNDNLIDIANNEVDGNSIFIISLAGKDSITSGTNSESIYQVKEMIGLNSRSLVLASADNYKNFINKFSFCGYNRTWSDPGSMIINSLIMKNYNQQLKNGNDYFKLTENDFKLTKSQKESIINCLERSGNQLAGVKYNIFDPELCKYSLYLYIKMKPGEFDKNYISNEIRKLIGEFFSNINSDIFIPKSDIIHLIKTNINSIDGVDAYFLSEKNEEAMNTNTYTKKNYIYNSNTGTYDMVIENVYVPEGVNPNLGLDSHGNIYLENNDQFPILMGGWKFENKNGELVNVVDPLTIVFE